MRAGERVDVGATILHSRKLPCICPRQFDKDATNSAQSFSFTDSRGIIIEHVQCSSCQRTWQRINVE